MDVNDVYSGDELGLPYRDILTEGIVGSGSLAVTAGAGNTVDVAVGAAWVLGDTDPNFQPNYRVYNDAIVNKGVSPDPSNPRKAIVVAQITDAGFSGATRRWDIAVILGTPAPSPTVPATPASALLLAELHIPTNAASSAAYTITDKRRQYSVASSGIQRRQTRVLYNSVGTPTAPFPDGSSGAQGHDFVVPSDYVEGTDITFKVLIRSGATGGSIRLERTSYLFRDGAVFNNWETGVASDFAISGTANFDQVYSAVIPYATAGMKPGDTIRVDITRVGTHANDTNTGTAVVDGHWIEYSGR